MIMKKLAIVLSMLFIALAASAQTDTAVKANDDPLDLSSQLEKVEKHGVPTVAMVQEMKEKAEMLYTNQMWEEAAVAYEEFAQKANWLANLISQCVEPYYSASYDDRKNASYTMLKDFIPYQNKANELKKQRHVAYVRIGLCYKNMGNNSQAVTYLHKGLDLLAIDQRTEWNEAAKALAEIVGFTK